MQSLEVKVNNCEVKEDGGEADQGKPCCSLAFPTSGCCGVEIRGINSPDNKGPDFFGVPTPESVPSLVSPDSSCYQGERPKNKTNDVELVRGSLKLVDLREDLENTSEPVGPRQLGCLDELALFHDQDACHGSSNHEESSCQYGNAYVNNKPVVLESRK